MYVCMCVCTHLYIYMYIHVYTQYINCINNIDFNKYLYNKYNIHVYIFLLLL